MADIFKVEVQSLQSYSLQKELPKRIQNLAGRGSLKDAYYQTVILLKSIIILPLNQ